MIIFIRHGEAEHNIAFHEKGPSIFSDPAYTDPPLTELGHTQAYEAGIEIAKNHGIKFNSVWCSPLTRCIQTALEVTKTISVEKMFLHDNLVEVLSETCTCNRRKEKRFLMDLYSEFNMTLLPETPSTWLGHEYAPHVRLRMSMIFHCLQHLSGNHLIVTHHDALFEILRSSFKNAEFREISRLVNH